MTNESDPDEKAAELRAHSRSDEARRLLCELGDHVRDVVVGARGIDMAADRGRDRRRHDLRDRPGRRRHVAPAGSRSTGPTSRWCPKGSTSRSSSGAIPTWTVIVDTIDGTRGLMYDKRPAWCLAAAAPRGGSLARRRRRRDDRAADGRSRARPTSSARCGAAVSSPSGRPPRRHAARVDGAAVDGDRPRARVRRARQVLRPGQAGARRSSRRELFERLGSAARVRRRVHLVGRSAPRADRRSRPLRRRPAPARRPPTRSRAIRTTCAPRCCSRKPAASSPIRSASRSTRRWTPRRRSPGSGTPTPTLAARIGPVLAELVR